MNNETEIKLNSETFHAIFFSRGTEKLNLTTVNGNTWEVSEM